MPVVFQKDGTRKVNKWFQLETDETDSFRDDLQIWKTCGAFDSRPPPLVVEIYLDTSALTSNQSLVIVDDHGQRWDVFEALNRYNDSPDGTSRPRKRDIEIILERWELKLTDAPARELYDFGATLPTIYKKCIIFFRSLYATAKFVPAWKFVRGLAKGSSRNNNHLRVNCRILNGHDIPTVRYDGLSYPLYDSDRPVTSEFDLGYTPCPAGKFSAKVAYRNDCNFRVDDSETLLSSQFMGADEGFFKPSLPIRNDSRQHDKGMEIGSLPAKRQSSEDNEPFQAYGSLSTFHGDVPPRGSSPISALRAVKTMGSDTSSPPASVTRAHPAPSSRVSLISVENAALARRSSASKFFQPFKAGSLCASPVPGTPTGRDGDQLPPPSPQSVLRGSGISTLAQARNRSSLTAGMPATLRGAPIAPENAAGSSVSSSPKPAPISRYSSSFSNRRGRISFGGTSRVVDDDQVSSGKQSLSSSAQPGSGILAEGGGSSGSLHADDNDISDFLKLLEAQKTLKSFEPSYGESSNKRTSAQLSKFQSMRESSNALVDSISSSMMLHRSSSSSSRQLTSVPPMIAGNSISTCSSPGKPISPHTPHTPAIPSRLSSNSIIDYSEPRRMPQRSRSSPQNLISNTADEDELGANAIDIPTSPRPYYPHARRSSSVAQQHRVTAVENGFSIGDLPFGIHRSISLGAEARDAPSLSALLDSAQRTKIATNSVSPEGLQPATHIAESPTEVGRDALSIEREEGPQPPPGLTPPYRPRLGRLMGRGVTPPQGSSYSSLTTDRGSGSGSGTSDRPGGRYSFTRPFGPYDTDDEPLLFDMSEIGRESRRSLEEVRGVGIAGSTVATDRGFDSSRGGDSASSSRRGSRRGW